MGFLEPTPDRTAADEFSAEACVAAARLQSCPLIAAIKKRTKAVSFTLVMFHLAKKVMAAT
jgi:hypothetical protein